MSAEGRAVALITGGGTGIGAATAEELAATGMAVALVGRRSVPLEATAAHIGERGGLAVCYPADVTDLAAMERVVRRVVAQFGQLDLLVANAAVHDVSEIVDGDPVVWRRVVETNVLGLLYSVRAVLPQMYRQQRGHIVIVSSVSGRVTYVGEPIYTASKHAGVAFGDCLRQEVAPRGIRVTLIEPGLVDTPMLEDNPFADELKKRVHPLEPADCARAIRFAVEQPAHCCVSEIVLRPAEQLL